MFIFYSILQCELQIYLQCKFKRNMFSQFCYFRMLKMSSHSIIIFHNLTCLKLKYLYHLKFYTLSIDIKYLYLQLFFVYLKKFSESNTVAIVKPHFCYNLKVFQCLFKRVTFLNIYSTTLKDVIILFSKVVTR